ncbi:DUF2062 domain-containing protein [Natronobiforma cellulositropha]|uniref:DUF2062 domain-containing protein n=1 Tax=Natronobiforma cellulositropha TaxID=1679076 RepID=UPI0021D61504|nr:DUF2062 domain-containing protein [Natronobiforma cellulositropha]
MIRDRLSVYRARVRRELTAAFEEEHTPREIAASFAIGIFVTAMPTGGLGIGLFFVLVYYYDWISKTAIFSSVIVLNPIVKPLVYVASFQVGALLVGTEPVVLFEHSLLNYAATAVQLVLLGNVLIALALAAVGYVLVLHLTRAHRRSQHVDEQFSPHAVLLAMRHRWRK